jgi:hypothetical protein
MSVRKKLRMSLLFLVLFVVPAVNALDMSCVPGVWIYYPRWGWHCTFVNDGNGCMLCSAEITVLG